jgi:hypothetical protein
MNTTTNSEALPLTPCLAPSIAQQLKIKEFPFEIKDSKGKQIYLEDFNGAWVKREYDSNGNLIYFENSFRFWVKREYDPEGNQIYFENSKGVIMDKRPKTDA